MSGATTDSIGGVTFEDPFRRLEDDGDEAVQSWQRERDESARLELARSPHRSAVVAAAAMTFADVFGYSAPVPVGRRWFRVSGSRLEVADSPLGSGRVVADVSDISAEATIIRFVPSPDGSLVVVVAGGGQDIRSLLYDADTGKVIRSIPGIAAYCYAWLPDNSGFYYQCLGFEISEDGAATPEAQVHWQPVDGDPVQQATPVAEPFSVPIVSADGRWAIVSAGITSLCPRWLRHLDGRWVPFLPHATATYKGSIVGDEFWAVTDDTSGWGRLVAIPLRTWEDEETWRELVQPTEGVRVSSATRCGARVALTVIVDGVHRLLSLHLDGTIVGEVPLPSYGAIGRSGTGHIQSTVDDVVIAHGDGCVFVSSSLDRSPGVYRADLVTLEVEELVAPAHVLPNRTVSLRSADQVAYRVFRKAGTPLDGTAPVIVTGYGGYNIPWLPVYSAMAATWTELGGIWVHTHLRGGGERDREFYQAGSFHGKQNGLDDLFTVVDALHAAGEAVPALTGLWGSSGGGLLVAAAATQRPELFGAVVAQVPMLDLLRLRKDAASLAVALGDWGNPDDPVDAPMLHAYSPYHQVRSGTRYPAMLFDASESDATCPPWHSRKTAARMSEATDSHRRVLLRVRRRTGHNQMTAEQWIERDVDELAFLADELGIPTA
ncbi:prolyl oligopeptidase family serine peptidase [Rhodococcus wratislaviensis]|uniref:prolyl oligopeptidase family serine peptidase n=1 Tax=Rhodococcus wratislaviensis TaxID=44752 RepID=UPI00138E1BFC|nr:prolyl oligopeptidase family serine peptidase [Rhodococcus wratislaviensis]